MYMRGLLTSIIQTQQQRRRSQSHNRANTRTNHNSNSGRRLFQLHNLSRPSSSRSRRQTPPTPTPSPLPESSPPPSTLSITLPDLRHNIPFFTTPLESNYNMNQVNQVNYTDTSTYYSLFQHNDVNIRYYHNERLQNQDSVEIINSILRYMYENEIQEDVPLLEDEPRQRKNDETVIQRIRSNSSKSCFSHIKDKIRNDVCPILLTEFQEDSSVYYFNSCLHALDESMYEQFVSTFQKCPLCNGSLVV